METIFDLPAHPLLVHFPVVAIPVLSLLALVMVVHSGFRDRYALPIIGLGAATAIATFVAAQSGEDFTESLGLSEEFIEPHKELGEMLRLFVLGLVLTIVALVAVNKRSAATGRDALSVAVGLFVVAFSLLSLVWTVRTGHEGAKAVWGTDDFSADSNEDEVVETTADTTAETTTTPAPAVTDPPSETTTTAQNTTAPAETTTTIVTETTTTVTVTEDPGQVLFESNCARCHAVDGSGGRGPSLQGFALENPDQAEAIEQITNGGNRMPSFGDELDAEQIQAIIDYVYATF